jgi:Tfp pilus assembly protein PilF
MVKILEGEACMTIAIEKKVWYEWTFLILLFFTILACSVSKENLIKAKTQMDIGTAYIEAGKYSMAIGELVKSSELNPDDPRVHYFLALAYHSINLEDKASKEIEKAIRLRKDYAEAYNLQGTILLGQKKNDQAISAFEKALSNVMYDTPTISLYNMGMAYYQKGDYKTAISKFQEAEIREPNSIIMPAVQINMAWTYFAVGEMDRAIERFKKALSITPDIAEPYYGLGKCYYEKKDKMQAAAAFRNVIRLLPDSEMAAKSKDKLKNMGMPVEESVSVPIIIEKKTK